MVNFQLSLIILFVVYKFGRGKVYEFVLAFVLARWDIASYSYYQHDKALKGNNAVDLTL